MKHTLNEVKYLPVMKVQQPTGVLMRGWLKEKELQSSSLADASPDRSMMVSVRACFSGIFSPDAL